MEDLVTLGAKRSAPTGFALFEKGFRPFFALASLFAIGIVPLWLLVRAGTLGWGGYLLPTAWHAHEMVFGYTMAVVAGFLLTAASNWTKRTTATGIFLVVLCFAWVVGRVAPLLGGVLPDEAIAAASLVFLPLVAIAVGRVVVLAKSRRNYGLVLVLALLFLAQLATHLGALAGSVRWQTTGPRLGVDLIVVIILVIGGRIIPMFTRNTTKAEGIRNLPWLDRLSIGSAVAIVAADALSVRGAALGAIAALAALASASRMRHWGTQHTLREPLLWVLHAGFAFVPLGFALRAIAAFVPSVSDSTALHALTAGAIGTLTLGMMTRVSIGHTGRELSAPTSLGIAFALVIFAAVVRVAGPLVGGSLTQPALYLSATAWTLAFAIYLVRIGPYLFKPRPDGEPG